MPERKNINPLFAVLLFAASLFLMGLMTDPPAPASRYPQGYFQSPVKRPVLLSGSFGELRTNHFHAGLDIKSAHGTTGDSLFSAAGGFVSRINIKADGYGNALYIQHPNGFTTLYAHLEKYRDDIAAYIKQMQYARENFEVELFPESSRFTLKQGDFIGLMGNTGSSGGPHLHFEIRHSRGDVPVNPLHFGFQVEDNIQPTIQGLKSYMLNERLEVVNEDYHNLRYISRGQYGLKDTLLLPAWRAGFSIKAYDQMDGAPNRNGIYKLDFLVDDSLQYSFSLDRIPFPETRYLNAHIDYPERMRGRGYWNRCYTLPGNKLNIYSLFDDAGIVKLFAQKARKVTIHSFDFFGNRSTLEFYVKRDENMIEFPRSPYHYSASPGVPLIIEEKDIRVEFPAGSFYENLSLSTTIETNDSKGYYSPIIKIEPSESAVHNYFNISLPYTGLSKVQLDKAFIAHRSGSGYWRNCGGTIFADHVHTQVRQLGEYVVMVDDKAPDIRPIVFSKNMRSYWRMAFRITDNVSTTGRASGLKFRATVDGEWILMEYDKKLNLLTHHFDGKITEGEHIFELKVWDDRQNVAVYTSNFTR